MNLHPCSSLTERGTCVVQVARVYSSKHVLQVSNRLSRCIENLANACDSSVALRFSITLVWKNES